MAVTLEQVEKLREHTKVSYEEAKAVLERHDGDLLEAIIDLERQGRSDTASKGGFYTTRAQDAPGAESLVPEPVPGGGKSGKRTWQRVGSGVYTVDGSGLWSAFKDLLRRSIANQLEVWHNGRLMTSIPVLVLILLMVFFFWVAVPLLVVGLVFGCRFRFNGPDLDRESVHKVMDQVSATVEDMKHTVKEEFNKKKS